MSTWYLFNQYIFNLAAIIRRFKSVLKFWNTPYRSHLIKSLRTEIRSCYLDSKFYLKQYLFKPKVDLNKFLPTGNQLFIEPRFQIFFYMIKKKINNSINPLQSLKRIIRIV